MKEKGKDDAERKDSGSCCDRQYRGLQDRVACEHSEKAGADVHVLMTENAENFIHPITFETLTGNKCLIDTFDRNFQYSVEHVSLAKLADVVMIAPAKC